MSNTDIKFSYTEGGSERTLIVSTGANSIYWGYSINANTIPTYGGEVVQILSCMITDINIEGECKNYLQMEDIYNYFVTYMQFASQGISGKETKFLGNPIRMSVPSRGWVLKIIPKVVPGFRIGTEVVAPEWKLVAQVFEDEGGASGSILSEIASKYYGTPDITIDQAISQTTTLSDIGYHPDSGFVNPSMSYDDKNTKSKPNKFDGAALKKDYKKRGEAFHQIVQSYIDNTKEDAYGNLFKNSSTPYEPKDKGKKDKNK